GIGPTARLLPCPRPQPTKYGIPRILSASAATTAGRIAATGFLKNGHARYCNPPPVPKVAARRAAAGRSAEAYPMFRSAFRRMGRPTPVRHPPLIHPAGRHAGRRPTVPKRTFGRRLIGGRTQKDEPVARKKIDGLLPNGGAYPAASPAPD